MAGFGGLVFLHALLLVLSSSKCRGANAATFLNVNRCSFTVWPGLLSGAETAQLPNTSFALQPGGWRRQHWWGQLCTVTGCTVDLNRGCLAELKVMNEVDMTVAVACNSDCGAFGGEQYCCSDALGCRTRASPPPTPSTSRRGCHKAYSYAYDDGTSTFTCADSSDYVITFCPSTPTSAKAAGGGRGNQDAGVAAAAGAAHVKSATAPATSTNVTAFPIGVVSSPFKSFCD